MTTASEFSGTPEEPGPGRRPWVGWLLAMLAAATIALGTWGLWRWATYPDLPDVTAASPEELADFMIDEDFSRLNRKDQRQIAMSYVDKLGELSLREIVLRAIPPDPKRRQIFDQLREAGLDKEVMAAMHAEFLDKYWSLSQGERQAFLSFLVLADKADQAQGGRRTVSDVRSQMAGVMGSQPPEVQGQMGQFLLELEQTRRQMGRGSLFAGE